MNRFPSTSFFPCRTDAIEVSGSNPSSKRMAFWSARGGPWDSWRLFPSKILPTLERDPLGSAWNANSGVGLVSSAPWMREAQSPVRIDMSGFCEKPKRVLERLERITKRDAQILLHG